MTCLQEDCANWDGDGCPCRVLDMEPVDVRGAPAGVDDDDEPCPSCGHDHPEADCDCGCEYDNAFCGRCGWLDCECPALTTSPGTTGGES